MPTLFPDTLPHLRPEFFPEVAEHASDHALHAANRRFPWRGRARGQPAVLDQIVEHVSRVAPPRRRQPAVAPLGEKRRLERVLHTGPEATPARGNVARLLAPHRAEPGFDRVGDRHVGFALEITLAEAARRPAPFLRRVEPGLPDAAEDADAKAARPDDAVDNPVHALETGDRDIRVSR